MNHYEVIASIYMIGVPDYANSGLRQNNFDLMRFLFAFVVFLIHAHVLPIAGVLVVSIAVLLWHRLEKAFLRKSSH